MDIFRTFFRHFSDILLTFPFSGLSNDFPVTNLKFPSFEQQSRFRECGHREAVPIRDTQSPPNLKGFETTDANLSWCLLAGAVVLGPGMVLARHVRRRDMPST